MTKATVTPESGDAAVSPDEGSEPKGKKAKVYTTRHDANIAYWQLSDEKREKVRIVEDEKTSTYSIQPFGK